MSECLCSCIDIYIGYEQVKAPIYYILFCSLENLDFKVRRSFYAYWHHEGCPKDMGWSVVLDESSEFCPWEQNNTQPSFMYCSESDPCLFTSE